MLLLAASSLNSLAQSIETHSFTGLNKAVPDGNAAGLSDVRMVTSTIASISSLRVKVSIAGEFNGDLYAYVRRKGGGTTNFCVLLNRVGRTAANPSGYDDAGLDVTFATGAANGNIHTYRDVAPPSSGAPLTGVWMPDGRRVDPAEVLDTSPVTTSLASFNGVSGNGEWTLFLADLDSGGTNMLQSWELEITGQAWPELAWATPADIVYGTPLGSEQLNASSPVAGTFVYDPPAGTALNAGPGQSLSVVFTPTDTASYVAVTSSVPLNVRKMDLTITANNASKVYGASLPTLSVSYSSFANGDTPASLDTPVELFTTATAASPADFYSITPSGATSANYSIILVEGVLAVTPAPLTITANHTNKVYGAPLPVMTAAYSGLVNGDTPTSLDTPVVLTTSATAASPAGLYPISPGEATSANYSIAFVDGQFTITKAGTIGLLSSSQNPALPGQEITFTFVPSAVPPGAGTPTGTVQFKINDINTGSPALLVGGAASLNISIPTAGTHEVLAEYAGDGNFTGVTNNLVPAQFINTPPVANTDVIERWPTNGAKVQIAVLLSNDTDADGDTITFTSVSAVSANGGGITRNGDWIHYAPPEGFTSEDEFTYTIADSRGQTAIGTVQVTIKVDTVPSPNLAITDLGNGSFLIRFDAIPDKTYRIEYTEDMNTPDWQTLGSGTADEVGILEYLDTPPGGTPRRFYRSVYP